MKRKHTHTHTHSAHLDLTWVIYFNNYYVGFNPVGDIYYYLAATNN